MSFLDTIKAAVSGGSSNPTPSGPTPAPVEVYNNSGTIVDPNQGHPSNQQQSQQTQQPSDPELSLEDIFFKAPENNQNNQSNQTQQQGQNQNQQQQQEAPVELAPGYTAQNLLEQVRQINMTTLLPEEQVQKALSGDSQALIGLINTSTQMSVALAVKQALELSQKSTKASLDAFTPTISSQVKNAQFESIYTDPRFSSPFLKPMVENLVSKIRERDPSATPEQIKETLPALIQHSMNSFNLADDSIKNRGTSQGARKQAEVNLDEFWNS